MTGSDSHAANNGKSKNAIHPTGRPSIDSQVDDTRPMGARKYMLTIWSLGENLLFGGLTFGWALLVVILKDEGVYSGLCSTGNTSDPVSTTPPGDSSEEYVQTCIAQERQLNLVFTVAVVVRALSGPFIGQLLYRRGVRATRILMTVALVAGLLMIAFTSVDTPWLLFPGLTSMAVGGEALFSSNIQAAYLFQSGSSFVVSLMSGMFDASASVMLIIKIVYDRGVARLYSFLAMAGAFVLLASISSIFLLPKTFFKDGEPVRYRKRSASVDITVTTVSDGKVYQRRASITSAEFRSNIIPPLRHCVLSPVFLSHVLWFSVLQLRWYFYLGAFNTWITLVTKGNEQQIHFFTDVSLYVQLCSIVMALVSGVVLGFERRRCSDKPTSIQRRLRPSLSLQAIACILAIVLSSVILVPSTNILYFVFIVAIALRTLIYGMGAAYIQMIFPVEYFGFLFGVLMCVGGVIGCFQYLLFVWMETNPISPQKVNIFLLVLTVISLIHPVHIWVICRRAAKKAATGERRVDKLENYDFLLRKRK